jgi:hypothetical protein
MDAISIALVGLIAAVAIAAVFYLMKPERS